MNTRRTRAKNATTHPGAVVLAAQGKWRTKAEKEADDNHAALEKAAAEKAEQECIVSIAKLVMQLRGEQNTATPESGASSERGPNSKSSASGAANQDQAQNDMESTVSGMKGTSSRPSTKSGTRAVNQGTKCQNQSGVKAKAKKGKTSLKVMINEVSRTISLDANEAAASRGFDANLSQYLPKDSEPVGGTITGWLARVQEKTPLQPVSAKASDTSTSVFKLNSQPSKAGTGSTKPTTQYSQTDAGITTKFGGFDLDCNEDDNNEEREVALGKGTERMNKNTALIIPSTPDSDSEIEASQIPPWYDSYKGTPPPSQPQVPSTVLRRFEMEASKIPSWYDNYEGTPPPSQPRVPSTALKRKIEEVLNRDPSEDKDLRLLKLSSDFGMEVDTANVITSDTRTTATASLFFLPCAYTTSVSVVHADDDSQPMAKKVKMEADDVSLSKKTKALEHKSRSDYKNIDLSVVADQKWTGVFMDTVILWAGGQTSIWSIPDETLATSLQEIFSTVYPDIEHEVTIHGPVFGVVSQRLLEWRSGFGSAALAMVIHYFWEMIENSTDIEGSNAAVQEIARRLIAPPLFPFTHEDCDKPSPQRNFRSPFIIKLIALAHLSKTFGAVNIPSLGTDKLQQGYDIESVIGLAAAALERAFTLVRDGVVNVRDAVKEMAGKKKKFTLPKTLNKVTGTMSKGNSMFSINNWGSETQSYTTALVKKGPENTSEIVRTALGLLNRVPEKFTSCYDGDVVDPRSLLW